MKKIPLEYGNYYHIFNRGNNYENIFTKEIDYLKFLDLFDIFISSVADTYAWCLMKNHFHLLVRIKEKHEIGFLNSQYSQSNYLDKKWKTYFPEQVDNNFTLKPNPTQQFKHLFGTYALWYNKRNNRKGSLFIKNFERKLVDNKRYYQNLIVYIHNNPVKHGFVEDTIEYPWTSYLLIDKDKQTFVKKKTVIEYFDDIENFRFVHKKKDYEKDIEHLIIE